MSDAPHHPEPGPDAPAEPQELSPGEAKLRAALAAPGVRDAMSQLDAIRRAPEPAAPDPIIVLPEKGGEVFVADTEAAAAYVQPTEPRRGRVPHTTLTRVQLDARVDPRRQPTARMMRSEVLPAEMATDATTTTDEKVAVRGPASGIGAEAEVETKAKAGAGSEPASPWLRAAPAPMIDAAALPSSHAPSSRPPPSSASPPAVGSKAGSGKRGAWWIPLVAACAGAIGLFAMLRHPGSLRDAGDGAGSGSAPVAMTGGTGSLATSAMTGSPSGTGIPAAMSSATPGVEAMTTGAAASSTGAAPAITGAAPMTTGTATGGAPASATASVKPAPKGSDDPYLDAGDLPGKAAPSAEPSAAPKATATPATTTPKPGPTLWFGED